MARFVMIRVEDNATAESFVSAVKAGEILFAEVVGPIEVDGREVDDVAWKPLEAEATAMWADPTKLCECHPSWERPNRLDDKKGAIGLNCGIVMSRNYGWTLCTACNKPHGFQVQHPKNLLVPDETPKTRNYYLGFRADRLKS